MAADKSIFLHILDLDPDEFKTILTLCVRLLYADGVAEIEEWNVLALLPALLDVLKENTPDHLKQKWEKKMIIANKAMETEQIEANLKSINIKHKIKSPEARKACLLLLFILANSDRVINRSELQFIMEEIARPWNLSKEDVLDILTEAEDEIPDSKTIITLLREY